MLATVFDLGHGIGVVYLEEGARSYVAELRMDGLRVLPQSIRPVQEVSKTTLEVDDRPTDQDRIDRMALAIARLRTRVGEFDDTTMSRGDPTELQEQARALALEVSRLTGGQA